MDISKKNVREYRKGNEKLSPKRNWQHRVHKTKTNKTQHRETGNIGYTRRRQTNTQHRETGNIGYTRRRQTNTQHNRYWTPLFGKESHK
jgi:hypothetical protein